jgi:hypothetical protein
MTTTHLPLDAWRVVEQHSRWTQLDLVSRHSTRAAVEAERDRQNGGPRERPYRACLIVEPIAERVGGHRTRYREPVRPAVRPTTQEIDVGTQNTVHACSAERGTPRAATIRTG